MKYALVVNGVIDTISLEPQAAPWVDVPDDVFAGFVQDPSGWRPPEIAPEPAPPEALNEAQWSYFLDLSGFRPTVEAALAALPKTTMAERAVWAGMKAVVYASKSYRLDVTLQLAAQVRAMGIARVPADAEIEAAWPLAVEFKGAESLLGN